MLLSLSTVSRRALLSGLAGAPLLPALGRPASAQAQLPVQPPQPNTQLPENSGFSFAACGDTRPMMYPDHLRCGNRYREELSASGELLSL